MRNLLITGILILLSCEAMPQISVHIKVEIENFKTNERVYFGVDGVWRNTLVNFSGNGNFSVDVNIQQLPSFISFETLSKRGSIDPQLPRLWFGNDTVSVKINWLNKSVESKDLLPFQVIAEKIEKLNGKERVNYLMQYPHEIPALYYTERYKSEIPLSDLENFMAKVPGEYRGLYVAKRIENYINAKRLGDVKIGEKITDFSLPDKDGNHISILASTGRTKLLTLFSSTCHYSIESIELIEAMNQQNNGKIDIVTIWVDLSKDTWLNYEKDKKAKINWTNLWDEFGFADAYLDVEVSPSYYVINENGVLEDKFHISKSSGKKLKRLIE